ncbi:phasin family protein [Pleionea mediterranea]|jgi:phasin family protein|uniref:Phasin family protein n=1 Tax=Pleionea mediterranea TaxID=523701 RepID=A0A316FSH0_9GAMM|nr:phasin family protein [Pleionea mediterranea]PWK51701.1 phasin family protein [Pleionea mediterranea]
MFAQMFNAAVEQSKTLFEPALQANQIATSQMQKLGQKQLSLINDYSTMGLQQLEKASKVTSLDDLQGMADEQLKASQTASEKLLKDSMQMVELGVAFSSEWQQLFAEKAQSFNAQQVAEPKSGKAK